MSHYHDVISWQSKDGTWSHGRYEVIGGGGFNEDGDDEWDRDFSSDSFEWVSTGHPSENAAYNAWKGSNPGGGSELEYSEANAKEIADLDEMAWAYKNPEAAAAKKDKAEQEWRKENLLSSVIPALGKPVTIKEFNPQGSGISYTGYLSRDEKGALVVEAKVFNETKKFVLLTPSGRVASGHKVSSITPQFNLPLYGRSSSSTKSTINKCLAPTPKGVCQRDTYSGKCWQHS